MNKLISVFAVSAALALPTLSTQALASGDHGGGYGHGHEMTHHESHNEERKGHHGEAYNDKAGHHDKKGGVGAPADASQAQKVVNVTLSDSMTINFKESLDAIKSGMVITFVIHNEGEIPHEFSIGDQEGQKSHAAMMRKMPSMVHNDGNTVTVQADETRNLTWRFEGDEEVVIACNIPGHYEAGMFRRLSLKK